MIKPTKTKMRDLVSPYVGFILSYSFYKTPITSSHCLAFNFDLDLDLDLG